jgi:hypothetical protein
VPALAGSTHRSLDLIQSAALPYISIREITFNPHSWQEVCIIKKLHIILYYSLILLMQVLFHFRRSFHKWPFLRKFGCTWKYASQSCTTFDSKGNPCISFLLSLCKWNQTLGKYHSSWDQMSCDHITSLNSPMADFILYCQTVSHHMCTNFMSERCNMCILFSENN